MKFLILPSFVLALLSGCATAPTPMTKTAVTAAVAAAAGFGLEQYPQAVPGVRIAEGVICSSANSTNLQPDQVVAALQAAGIADAQSKFIINGAVAIYDTVFASYGASWVDHQPALQGYLQAICDGLGQALPPTPPTAAARKPLQAHLR